MSFSFFLNHHFKNLSKEVNHSSQRVNHYIESVMNHPKKIISLKGRLPKEFSEQVAKFQKAWNHYNSKNAAHKESETLKTIIETTQMMAHDIRKPFTQLKVGLNLIQEDQSQEEMIKQVKNIKSIVNKSVHDVDSILSDILAYGNNSQLDKKENHLEEILLSSLQSHKKAYPDRDYDIRYDFKELAPVNIDKERIQRVFSNIVDNAFEAMGKSGTLFFTSKLIPCQNILQFKISNDGPAIPKDKLPLIFDAFATFGKPKGTGLGLLIAKNIMLAHGGNLTCTSPGDIANVEFTMAFQYSGASYKPNTDTLPNKFSNILHNQDENKEQIFSRWYKEYQNRLYS